MLSSVPPPLTSETPAGSPATPRLSPLVVGVADDDLVGAAFETAPETASRSPRMRRRASCHSSVPCSVWASWQTPLTPSRSMLMKTFTRAPSVSSARGRRRRSMSAITISTTAIAAVTTKVISGPLDLAVTAPLPPLTGCT